MLFYLLIIQLMVYNRTITRFIADDKVAVGFTQQLSTMSFVTFELEIAVNFPVHFEQRMAVLCEVLRADWCLFGLSS